MSLSTGWSVFAGNLLLVGFKASQQKTEFLGFPPVLRHHEVPFEGDLGKASHPAPCAFRVSGHLRPGGAKARRRGGEEHDGEEAGKRWVPRLGFLGVCFGFGRKIVVLVEQIVVLLEQLLFL